MYIQGDLRHLAYSDNTDTIDLWLRPATPARTMLHMTQHHAALGIDFYFGGMATAPITYSPPIAIGSLFLDDVKKGEHPSSARLWGKAIRVNGINNESVAVDYLFGSTYADRWQLALDDFRGYLDGQPSAPGFTASLPTTPTYPVDMGRAGETFKLVATLTHQFSARDIQVGVFRPAPKFANIERDAAGIRLSFIIDSNRTYRLESFATLGGAPSVVATKLAVPEFLDTTIGAAPVRYYRLVEE